jgi:hypothetical protein
MAFWNRGDDLERELRAQRPEPRPEFLNALESRIHDSRYRRPGRVLRVGVAGALTAGMLAALAGFGGLGYAATGVSHAVKSAVHVVAPAHKAGPAGGLSSAKAQYKVQMCLRGHTISVDSHAVGGLTTAGATPGACAGGAFTPATKLVRACFKGQNIQVSPAARVALLKAKLGVKPGFCTK